MPGRLSLFAIMFGLGASALAGVLIGAVGGFVLTLLNPSGLAWLGAPGSAPPDTAAAMLFVGAVLSGSLAGGYAAARVATGDELINAFVTGVLLLALTMMSYEEPWFHQLPLWGKSIILVLSLPLSVAGGYVHRGTSRHSDA